MKKKMKRFFTFFVALVMLFAIVLAGCSNKEPSQTTKEDAATTTAGESQSASQELQVKERFPIVKDKITLKFARLGWTDVRPPAGDLWMWKEYENMTNIHIEWEEMALASYVERRSVILASNDLPDCFYQMPFTSDEISKYGSDTTFIPLEKLIEENSPALFDYLQKNPVVKQAVSMPDGHIYSLPYVQPEITSNSVIYYVNQTWLNDLGLAIPKTLDEYTNVLREFKKAKNVAPVELPATFISVIFEKCLYGAFGISNRGGQAGTALIDEGPDGKVRFFVKDPRFKEVWQYLNLLWKEGLLHKETFTGIDYARWTADASKDLIGAFNFVTPEYIGAEAAKSFTGIVQLKGPYGDQQLSWVEPPVRGISSYMITKNNKYPVESMKWVDYFYSEEGSFFGTFGKEGVTYTKDANGNIQYIDEIKNYKSGAQLGSFQYVDNVYGGLYPYIEPPVDLTYAARGITFEDKIRAPREDYALFAPKTMWPAFNSTPEESAEITPLLTDIGTLIEEMRAKFVMGELNFDSDWDGFMDRLDKAGAQRYVEIKQQQFDRMSK